MSPPNWEHLIWIKSFFFFFFNLSTGDVDGRHYVSRVSVKPSDAASHGRAHQVLVDVQRHQIGRAALQHLRTSPRLYFAIGSLGCSSRFRLYLPDHLGGNGRLAHHRLSPARDPVYGGGLLVGAVVAADRQHLRVWVLLLQPAQGRLRPLGKTALPALGTPKK